MSMASQVSRSSSILAKSVIETFRDPCIDARISISGWVKTIRKQKRVTFIEINDGSSPANLQIVTEPTIADK